MEGTRKYLVAGYNMDQDDIDSLAMWCANQPNGSEFDRFYVMPIPRDKSGKRVKV